MCDGHYALSLSQFSQCLVVTSINSMIRSTETVTHSTVEWMTKWPKLQVQGQLLVSCVGVLIATMLNLQCTELLRIPSGIYLPHYNLYEKAVPLRVEHTYLLECKIIPNIFIRLTVNQRRKSLQIQIQREYMLLL